MILGYIYSQTIHLSILVVRFNREAEVEPQETKTGWEPKNLQHSLNGTTAPLQKVCLQLVVVF